jgi:hypothetical protein
MSAGLPRKAGKVTGARTRPCPPAFAGCPLLAILLACACSSYGGFEEKEAEVLCALLARCDLLGDVAANSEEDCVAGMQVGSGSCEGYDEDMARDCLDGIDALSCDDYERGFFPAACSDLCTGP